MRRRCWQWLVVGAVAALATTVYGGDSAEHGHAHPDGAAAHTAAAPSPAARTVREQWQLITTRESEARALVAARKLGELHRVAYALRDLVAGLPALSGDLAEGRRTALASSVKYVATLAARLDAAGDAGDQGGAETSLDQLTKVLGAIEALYPPATIGPASRSEPQGRATITGEIVDATCYLERGEAGRGPAHRDCAIRCIEEGRPPFVRDEETGRLYLAAFPESTPEERQRWLAQVGNRVRVTGRIEERDGMRLLEVEEVKSEHDHEAAPHGGVVGMSGDRHLEVVTTAENEIRVYLLDAFMNPVSVTAAKGSAVVRGASSRRSTLTSDPKGEYLRVVDARLTPEDEDITVTLEIGGTPLTMTLPFREGDNGGRAEVEGSAGHQHHH